MENAVLRAIEDLELFKKGDVVTVALSGGADSMALLCVLLEVKAKLGITVKAAHFNHHIRGQEAQRDENFVKQECRKRGVELFCGGADVPKFASENGLSTELAARKLRYNFLESINEGVIATAHTASDNLETVIFNLTRGSSAAGLCGIPIKRDIFVRPLLFCTREQIEEYCKEKSIEFVTDSTNLTDEYARNKIRHNVIPVLKSINPSVERAVLRTTASLKEDTIFLGELAQDYINENTTCDNELILNSFSILHLSLAKRVIINYVKKINADISLEAVHIDAILNIIRNTGSVNLPNGFIAKVQGGKLKVLKSGQEEEKSQFFTKITKVRKNEDFFKNINNLLLKNALDCDKIIGKLEMRTRNAGDSVRLKNRGCTKALNKLYNEYKVPQEDRENLPVLSDDKGVVWVYGIGVAHRCAVGSDTENIYVIEAEKKVKEN